MSAPRARACSSSSTTSAAAPSASTKPERVGVERARRQLRVSPPSASARIAQNPASTTGISTASVPPAMITSAWSRLITSAASPTASVPVAHAPDDGVVDPARADRGGHVAGGRVGQHVGDPVGRDPARPALVQHALLARGCTPCRPRSFPGSPRCGRERRRSHPRRRSLPSRPPFPGGRRARYGESPSGPSPTVGSNSLTSPAMSTGVGRGVEPRDAGDAALAGHEVRPARRHIVADGRDGSRAR